MNRIPTNRPKIIITASPRGVETVSIRVRPGERDMGLLFLRQVLPAIRTVNLRAQFVSPKAPYELADSQPIQTPARGRPSSELLTWRKREMDTMDKIPMVDVTTLDSDEQEARRLEMEQNEERA